MKTRTTAPHRTSRSYIRCGTIVTSCHRPPHLPKNSNPFGTVHEIIDGVDCPTVHGTSYPTITLGLTNYVSRNCNYVKYNGINALQHQTLKLRRFTIYTYNDDAQGGRGRGEGEGRGGGKHIGANNTRFDCVSNKPNILTYPSTMNL